MTYWPLCTGRAGAEGQDAHLDQWERRGALHELQNGEIIKSISSHWSLTPTEIVTASLHSSSLFTKTAETSFSAFQDENLSESLPDFFFIFLRTNQNEETTTKTWEFYHSQVSEEFWWWWWPSHQTVVTIVLFFFCSPGLSSDFIHCCFLKIDEWQLKIIKLYQKHTLSKPPISSEIL